MMMTTWPSPESVHLPAMVAVSGGALSLNWVGKKCLAPDLAEDPGSLGA